MEGRRSSVPNGQTSLLSLSSSLILISLLGICLFCASTQADSPIHAGDTFQNPLSFGKSQHSESVTLFVERRPLASDIIQHGSLRRLLGRMQGDVSTSGAAGGIKVSGPGVTTEKGAVGALGVLKKKKGMLDAFISSLSMILVTEIGDETFIIAALMAMRHSRSVVLAGALSALAIMTVLSTGLGMIVPNLISKQATNHAAAALYTFFGLRLLYIAWRADPKDTPQKELEEVQEKLEEDEMKQKKMRGLKKLAATVCSPVFLEAFILTFLAEWGDRSQIATITLAAHKNAIGVTVGATLGHVVCTSLAVVGGRLLALRISQRTVAMVGGLLFLVFAVHSYIAPITEDD